MHQTETERFAFLYLCGKRDRRLLQEKEKMTFSDFNRLAYITDFLGFEKYNQAVWSQYFGQFREELRSICQQDDDMCGSVPYDESEDDDLHEQWLMEFIRNALDPEARKWLEKSVGHDIMVGKRECAKARKGES